MMIFYAEIDRETGAKRVKKGGKIRKKKVRLGSADLWITEI